MLSAVFLQHVLNADWLQKFNFYELFWVGEWASHLQDRELMLPCLCVSVCMSSPTLHYNCPTYMGACERSELMMCTHGRTLSNRLVAFTLCRVHVVCRQGGGDCFNTLIARVRFRVWVRRPRLVSIRLCSVNVPAQLVTDTPPAWGDTLQLYCSEWKGPCGRRLVPSFHWQRCLFLNAGNPGGHWQERRRPRWCWWVYWWVEVISGISATIHRDAVRVKAQGGSWNNKCKKYQ